MSLSKSKLFDLKDQILREEGFFHSEEQINTAFDTFANQDLSTLLEDLYELMFRYETSVAIEDTPSDAPPFGSNPDYAPSEHIWEMMHNLVCVMILKNEIGELNVAE
jgi:hypothetical protein